MSDKFIDDVVDDVSTNINIVELQGHRILVLSGEIDVSKAPQFKQAVRSILDGNEQHLIVDMHKVTYMDSTGLGILISTVKHLSPYGKKVNLVGCNPNINRMMVITQISTFMTLYETMEDALKVISA